MWTTIARARSAKPGSLHQAAPGATYVRGRHGRHGAHPTAVAAAAALISLSGIAELSAIELGEPTRIGALATVSDVIAHPTIGESYPVLCEAGRALGSQQIRNRATLAGNLCNASPCATPRCRCWC